jgi:hypothetical protein
MKKFIYAVLLSFTVLSLAVAFSAQSNTRKTNARPTASSEEKAPTPTIEAEPAKTPLPKKNGRPETTGAVKENAPRTENAPNYFYEFSQPAFTIAKISIEHDDRGKGKISFVKSISSEEISDPIEVSTAALEKINGILTALNFFESSENYQYEKDYSHLGNIRIKIRKNGRERETKFNWTQNPEARALADEYRKIANQYIWIFDMKLSRENQPLESPRLMDMLDAYYKRREISDPAQLVPFLKELADDERIPLIARNHASRMVKTIEKAEK